MPKEPIKYILYIIYLYILKENVAEVHQLVLQLLPQHLLTVLPLIDSIFLFFCLLFISRRKHENEGYSYQI